MLITKLVQRKRRRAVAFRRVLPALCIGLFLANPNAAWAQAEPVICEYDPALASVLCAVEVGPLEVHDVRINDGACRVWDHRLLRAGLAARLRSSGQIAAGGEYTKPDLDVISEAIVDELRNREFQEGSFFRVESYRCTINSIALETSLGQFIFRRGN